LPLRMSSILHGKNMMTRQPIRQASCYRLTSRCDLGLRMRRGRHYSGGLLLPFTHRANIRGALTTYFLKKTDLHTPQQGLYRNSDPTVYSFLLAIQRPKATAFLLKLAINRAHNILPQRNDLHIPQQGLSRNSDPTVCSCLNGNSMTKSHGVLTGACLVVVNRAYNIHHQRTTPYFLSGSFQEQRPNSLFLFERQFNDRRSRAFVLRVSLEFASAIHLSLGRHSSPAQKQWNYSHQRQHRVIFLKYSSYVANHDLPYGHLSLPFGLLRSQVFNEALPPSICLPQRAQHLRTKRHTNQTEAPYKSARVCACPR
jgi:hypothetical protein